MVYKDMFRFLKLPDLFSIIGLVFALLAIFYSLKNELVIAASFIYLSAIADFLDGKIARRIKRKDSFGSVLDSICDVVLYLLAIMIFGYFAGLQDTKAIIVFIIFIVAGVMRLARFTIMGTVNNCYVGLPVSYSLIIPIVYFIFKHFNVSLEYLLLFYLIPSFFMISSIKVKKFIR